MNKLVLLSNDGRIIGIAGHAWKLLPGQRRQLLAEGERLIAGELIELEGNADILIQPITAGALSVGELPDANEYRLSETPSVTLATDERSDDQKAAIEEQTADEGLMTPTTIPLLTPSITPDAGIGTGLDNLPVVLATLSDQTARDCLALITIDTPITPDNIVNSRESRALSIAGQVVNVEPLRPVILTLTDQAGHQWQLQTAVNSDGSSWQMEADLTRSGLLDGVITITAETSDLASNIARDSTTFLLDTVTEVTLELAPQSDSCYGKAADKPDNPTSDNIPVMTGTGEVNSTIALFADDQLLKSDIPVGSNGTWSAQIIQPLSDGPHTLTAKITDRAGNTATAELLLSIDTEAGIWINDIDTYGINFFNMPITGETTGIENGQSVTVFFGPGVFQNRITAEVPVEEVPSKVPVEDNHWNHPPFTLPITEGDNYQVVASVTDCACTIATDHLMPLGNPPGINIQERVDMGATIDIDPIAASGTALSFEPAYLTDLPDNINIIDNGSSFPVSWQITDPKTLTAVYHDGTSTQTALTFTLPDSGTGLATLQVDRPFFHPGGNDELSFILPYQKSLYSPTYQRTHYSKAGLRVTITDDVPTLVDHTPVLVQEGTTALWSEHNGKLFTPALAGSDGGLLTAINGTPLTSSHNLSGDIADFYPFSGQYGTLYVNPDGAWKYSATPNLVHTTNSTLTETFTFTVTDTDGDSGSATICFTVLDGTALSFSNDTVSTMPIDQECDQPGPISDYGQITVLKGSDPLPPDQLQLDINATAEQLNNALASRLPNSDGESLDLDNLHPGPGNQSLMLSTLSGKPVLSIDLENISTDTSGNLSANLKVKQLTNLDVTEPEPAMIPVVLTASDHDLNTISHTVTLSVIDGGVTLRDDHIELTEGETVTGNLLDNDVQCLETLTITKVSLDRFYLDKNTTAKTGQVFDFQSGTLIETLYGTFTVQPDGQYTYTALDSLYHPGQQPLPQEFTYTVTDSSGDTAHAAVSVSIKDGPAATGNEQVNLTFSENNLTTSPRYPEYYAGPIATLHGDGSDAIDPQSLRFTADPDNLNGILTSLGTPVSFTSAGNQLRGSVIENGQNIDILTLSLSAVNKNNKNLMVRINGELVRPLDHLAGTVGNNSVMVNGERIILSLPFTYDDIDGTPAVTESMVTVTVVDGVFPVLSNPSKINIDEVNLPVTATGTITATPKSDRIVPDSWQFSASQPGLNGLFANQQPLTWKAQGPTLSLHWPAQPESPVLTVTLDDQPLPALSASLHYTVKLSHPMDQDKGSWPLSIAVAITDSDGDTTEKQIPVQINDVSSNLELKLAINDLEMTEPLYQRTPASERINVDIRADTDAVIKVWFLPPDVDSSGFALDDLGNRLTADGLPIRYFGPSAGVRYPETWEAWSIQDGKQKDHIFSLTTIQHDGTVIYVPPGTSVTATIGITWYHYLDHLTATRLNTPMLPVSYTLQAIDADGTKTSDILTLSLLDGEYPTPGKITQPPATTDINKSNDTSVTGTLDYTPGSDRPIPVFDRFTIAQEVAGLSSDGKPLTGITVSGPDQSVLTISRANDNLPVFRFSVNDPQPTAATIQFEQLDNLDHPPSLASQSNSIILTIPVLMSDSDNSLNSTPANFLYTVVDTVPVANGNYYRKNNQPIGEEGKTFSGNLLTNDTLNADADNARLTAITYQNMVYPVSPTDTTTITTDVGILIVQSNGRWWFLSYPHINHSAGQNFTLKMFHTIVDGDGDNSSAPFQITIADRAATFTSVINTEGPEDTQTPIALSFSIDLGDPDRQETLTNLSVSTRDLQGGTLIWNGKLLSATGDTVHIPLAAMSRSMVSGSIILSAVNLGYLPAADASDFTLHNHQVTLNLNATISNNPGSVQSLSTPVVIHVKGVADPPTWPEQIPVVTGEEDQSIPLGNSIKASLKDKDGSEVLSYQIMQLPDSMKLLCHGQEINAGTTLTPEQFGQLIVQSDEHWSGRLAIKVDAIATEQGYFAVETARSPATITVNVQPVADPPTLVVMPAGADPDTVKITGHEDERIAIGNHIKAALVDTDGSESLFLTVTPLVKPGEATGRLWIRQGSAWTEIKLGSTNHFEVTGPDIDHLYYQPGKDRSSANFDDVRLQINAISRESTQDGLTPVAGKEEAISPDRFMQISIKGVPDSPEVTPNDTWTVNPDKVNELTGRGQEDQRLPLVFDLHSTDMDGSESLNSVVTLKDSQFRLEDNHGRQPPIAFLVNDKPFFQITAADLISGKYRLTPPPDYAGETLVPMKVLVTELDGAHTIFDYQLRAVFAPVVDTRDQAIAPIRGNEVELDIAGKFLSGGAPLALTGFTPGDSDGSEAMTDITGFNLPDGFQLMVNGALLANQCGSLVDHTGGLDALKRALAAGDIRIVPIHSDGTIDHDYPTPTHQRNDFSFTVEISDQQNGLTAKKEVIISGHIDWQGEVDGEQPPATPFNPDENTRVVIDNPGPFTGNDFPLRALQLVATDKDGSERIKDDKRPQYEIEVYDPAGNKVTGGWHLQTSGGQELIFDNDKWLIQSGKLDGVSVHFTEKGTYFIHTKVIVEDAGDEEARYARMQVIVEENTGGPDQPIPPESLFVCSEPVEGKEDYYFTIPDHCIDLDQTHTSSEEETTFRMTVTDLHGWSLKGFTTVYWNNDGEVTEYITRPEDVGNLQFRPPRDFSGEDSITYHILKRNTDSDQTSKTDFKIPFKVLPVVENSPDEPPEDSVYDLRAWTKPAAEADEWKDADQPEPMHLQLRTTDIDGSETIEKVVFKPPDNIVIRGDGLQPDNSVVRQTSETEAQFEQRIASFTFTPGPGLPAGTYTMPLAVEVLDTAPGTGDTDSKVFSKAIDLMVKPVNHCATLTAPNQEGHEDSDIPIKGLIAALNDSDGSEVISVALSGLPDGKVVKDSSGKPLPFNGSGKWQIPAHLMDNNGHVQPLFLRPVKDFSGVVQLTLNSHSHEQSLSTVCSDEQAFQITVQPVGDPITLDQIPGAMTGDENTPIVFRLNAKTTDTHSDKHDHPEELQATLTILPGNAPTLMPPEPEAIKPSLTIPGQTTTIFSANASGGYTATIATADTTLPELEFNPGDGHGTLLMSLAVRSVDKTDGLTTAYGPEVVMDSTITIAPKSDKPSLQIDRKSIITTVETPVPVFLRASVINPALTVSNLVGTELYTLVQGLPGSASLVNHAGTPTGTPSSSPAGIALVSNELQNLYLKDHQTGSYTLNVEAISDVGDGNNQSSDVIELNIVVFEKSKDISGTPNSDIIVSDGTTPKISAGNGDDLIAGGNGENQILPGSGNNTVWGGAYSGSGDGRRDTFLFEAGDTGTTAIQDFEPGVDVIDLSQLLNLDDVWSGSDLANQVTIDEVDGKARITALSEVITLDTIPLETLLPGGNTMDTAERLSSLVEQGHLIVSHQFGHQGKDTLYAPPAAELKGDGIVNAGAGDDHLYANNEGSKLRGGSGNDILELSPTSHAIDRLYWRKEDAGSEAAPAYDRVFNFHSAEDVIDISGFLPAEARAQPYDYMALNTNGSSTHLNLASTSAHQWTNTIELADVDWLQGSSSEDALKYQLEQGYLIATI
ncbi:Ig-like domain-containing protein [Salinisphaera sp. G21_0]|uniref:Ig-like domain-containing protein n=1 Tax=Salinisphaera sp. G21_0 TaxID=2821094 RepID=UPI001ADCC955|nr:Ig-like domain-containing protein [Salinisphaera sp. G21_0]MBO9481162.1 VCBS domain-containing protein [Salinisphaera sp. G21_0]